MNLNQITLPSHHLSDDIPFYETLGFRPIVIDKTYARFACPTGDTTLSLDATAHLARAHGVTVYLETDDLDARVDTLKAQGLVFTHDPVDQPWHWREARLKDPSGNTLCLYRAGEMRRNPPHRVRP